MTTLPSLSQLEAIAKAELSARTSDPSEAGMAAGAAFEATFSPSTALALIHQIKELEAALLHERALHPEMCSPEDEDYVTR